MFIYAHPYKMLFDLSKNAINNYELIIALVCKQISYDKMLPFMPNWLAFSWDFFVLTKNFLKYSFYLWHFIKKLVEGYERGDHHPPLQLRRERKCMIEPNRTEWQVRCAFNAFCKRVL